MLYESDMKKTIFNIDRIKVCLLQPENFYITLHNDLAKSVDGKVYYDGFYLSACTAAQVNDKDITVKLFLIDKAPVELGTFVFNQSKKYGRKCFFTYNTKCLYDTAGYVYEGTGMKKYNYFNYPFLVFSHLGLSFNNVTSIEIAVDTEHKIINRIQYAVSHPEIFYMILCGKIVNDPEEILDGYWEYYQRSRVRKSTQPSLYIHPIRTESTSTGNKCELKVYDKARELAQVRKDKEVLVHAWDEMTGEIQRLEVSIENKKFRQCFDRMNKLYPNRWLYGGLKPATPTERKRNYGDALEHFFFDLGINEELRYEVFEYHVNNLLHFKLHNRDKKQVSILDLLVNPLQAYKQSIKRK